MSLRFRFFASALLLASCAVVVTAGGAPRQSDNVIFRGHSTDGIVNGDRWFFFRLHLVSDGECRVYTTGEVDTVGALLDQALGILAEDDDGGEGANFMIEGELAAGTYYVAVRGNRPDSSGRFTLHVDGGGPVERNCSTAIPLRNVVAANTHSEVYGLRVEGTTPTFYRVEVEAGNIIIYSEGDIDTVGRLFDSDCQLLAEDDDGGEDANFRIENPLAAEIYYISVRGKDQAASGTFTLHIVNMPDEEPGVVDCSDAVQLRNITAVGAHIELSGSSVRGTVPQFFGFQSTAGRLQIYTTGETDTFGRLHDSDCRVLAEDDDGGEGANFRIEYPLAEGAYYVSVQGAGQDVSGPFTLHFENSDISGETDAVERESPAGGAEPVVVGSYPERQVRLALERYFSARRDFDLDEALAMSTGPARDHFEGYVQLLRSDPEYRESERQIAATLRWQILSVSVGEARRRAVADLSVGISEGGEWIQVAVTLWRENRVWRVAEGMPF